MEPGFSLYNTLESVTGERLSTSANSETIGGSDSKNIQPQNYHYFLVLDFEATCKKDEKILPVQEIIEFPVCKVSARTFEIEATFHKYVQPTKNKKLTNFCTELTGITQDKVDNKPVLEEVLILLHEWMEEEKLHDENVRSIFVTCGDWDLKTALPNQCDYFGIEYKDYLKEWINIKQVFERVTGKRAGRPDLPNMLKAFDLTLDGHYHSGLADSQNISKVLKAIAETGYVFKKTGTLS